MILLHPAANPNANPNTYLTQAAAILHTFYHHDHHSLDAGNGTDSLDTPVSVIPESPFLHAENAIDNGIDEENKDENPAKRPRLHSSEDPVLDAHASAEHHHHHQLPLPLSLPEKQEDAEQPPDPYPYPGQNIILPPPPPIASRPFTTHLTPTLSLLAQRLNLARVFVPLSQSREVTVLERGYWFIRLLLSGCNSGGDARADGVWGTELFTRFWTFLHEFISEGRAGWGVWCVREKDADSYHVVKIYSWGEVMPHIYLLLFLASERHIRKLGVQWRDATDDVVVQML